MRLVAAIQAAQEQLSSQHLHPEQRTDQRLCTRQSSLCLRNGSSRTSPSYTQAISGTCRSLERAVLRC